MQRSWVRDGDTEIAYHQNGCTIASGVAGVGLSEAKETPEFRCWLVDDISDRTVQRNQLISQGNRVRAIPL